MKMVMGSGPNGLGDGADVTQVKVETLMTCTEPHARPLPRVTEGGLVPLKPLPTNVSSVPPAGKERGGEEAYKCVLRF